jgi:hypothetical protein
VNAGVFVSNLEACGVNITRDGNDLRIKARRGVSVDSYIDLIRLNKAGLLAALAGETSDIPWITPDDLHWVHVNQREVDETVPPAERVGILPTDCAWSHLCTVLGPCPHASEGQCRSQKRESRLAAPAPPPH